MRIHGLLRAVVMILTISLALVLLPIAINVGTGGTAPVILEPYVGWTWPAIGVLWAIAIVTGLLEIRSRRTGAQYARSADQPRNRPNALDRVERYLEGRFAGSLAYRTRLALDLDEPPGAELHPYDLLVRPLGGVDTQVRSGGDIATVFDELQDSMLILGARGRQDHAAARPGPLTGRASAQRSRPAHSGPGRLGRLDRTGCLRPGSSRRRRPR